MYTISPLYGAIIGDIAGSFYEGRTPRKRDFKLFTRHSRFTDDTVMTLAVAECILRVATKQPDAIKIFKEYANRYPEAGYGDMFWAWVKSDDYQPADSYGNGAAMRTSPVAWAFSENVDRIAGYFGGLTHSNKEACEGAVIITNAIQFAAVREK